MLISASAVCVRPFASGEGHQRLTSAPLRLDVIDGIEHFESEIVAASGQFAMELPKRL